MSELFNGRIKNTALLVLKQCQHQKSGKTILQKINLSKDHEGYSMRIQPPPHLRHKEQNKL